MIIVDFQLWIRCRRFSMNQQFFMNENYREAMCGCVKSLKKISFRQRLLRHQRGLNSQFVLRFRIDNDKLDSEVEESAVEKVKTLNLNMLKFWNLFIVPLSFEVLTIKSIILHEHHVMKERNFGD